MAIDFSSIGAAPAPTEVAPSPTGVSVNLEKNTVLNLTKSNPSLRRVKLAAGWDTAQAGADVDLDISVFLLDNNKIKSVQDVVYYNNLQGPGVKLDGDNRTGAGDGDDESLHINFSQIPSNYNKIITTVTIYDAQNRRQTFGQTLALHFASGVRHRAAGAISHCRAPGHGCAPRAPTASAAPPATGVVARRHTRVPPIAAASHLAKLAWRPAPWPRAPGGAP